MISLYYELNSCDFISHEEDSKHNSEECHLLLLCSTGFILVVSADFHCVKAIMLHINVVSK